VRGMKMKRNLPLIILLSSLVMGCTQHKTDMPRQLVKALPQYPAYAAANYIKGRVDVRFDIGADGTVTRIEFIRSEPHHLFDEGTTPRSVNAVNPGVYRF
jgi:outer membrane biosynthesis protein TonB